MKMDKSVIQTTCGHYVKSIDDIYDLQVKAYDAHMNRIVNYGCYCKACAEALEKSSQIIHTIEELQTWTNSTSLNEKEALILGLAKSMLQYKNKNVNQFASLVIEYLNNKDANDKKYVVKVNTNSDFTLTIGEVSITGIGKIEFTGKQEAIQALTGASITWVKPVKSHMPGDVYIIREDDIHLCKFFVEYCSDAAKKIETGETSISIKSNNYLLEVFES